MKTPFVWLGSGRTRKWDVGDKALLLDQAAKSGLPVPPGAVLLDEFLKLVVDEGVVVETDGRFTVPDPQWLSETLFNGIRFPRIDNAVAIREAFPFATNHCTPRLSVNLNDPAQLSTALCELWSSVPDINLRRDLLIMEMVDSKTAGTALSRISHELDEIQIKGKMLNNDAVSNLPQLSTWQRPNPDIPDYAQRLQQLLRGLRRTFGKGIWQADWMDDGRICWLLGIKRMTNHN